MAGLRKFLFGCAVASAALSVAYVLGIWRAGTTEHSDSVAPYEGAERDFIDAGRGIPRLAERQSRETEQARQVADAEGSTHSTVLELGRPTPTQDSTAASGIEGGDLTQSAQEGRGGLSAKFPLEGRDEDWANAAESALFVQLSETMNLSLTSLRVECRETICWLQMVFPNQELFQAYLDGGDGVEFRPLFEIADLQPFVAVDHQPDRATANFYFVRRDVSSTQSSTVVTAGA